MQIFISTILDWGGIALKRVFFVIIAFVLLLPVARLAMQDVNSAHIEITGVNPSALPTVTITTNVFDRVGQPVFGLTKDDFVITGDLADRARIVSVENITDSNLTFSVVLAIDTSSSMSGLPIERAKEAATAFINTIQSNDPSVAIVAFDSTERLVQDYTSDKDVLLSAINNLYYGGKTALYDGSLLAVQKAAESPSPRRAVIILSDGAEFGGRSSAVREAALQEALKRGVPVYTIGLGYGIDRSFLQDLSAGTNAKNYESPSPEELLSIYQGLAATLQSQYVITAEVDVPADGTTYQLGIQSNTPDGALTASADLRAPIPVPIVSLPTFADQPISETTDVTIDVKADDPLTSAEAQINGASVGSFTTPPYVLTIDPVTLPPGTNTLSFSVTDANGDVGTATGSFEVAALPSTVTISGLPEGALDASQDVSLDVTGQTPAVSASYSVDGGTGTVVTDAPYTFTLNPYDYTVGDHTLAVDVPNQGGATAHVEAPFSVAAVPPVISLSLEAGHKISSSTEVTATVTETQAPVTNIAMSIGDTDLTSVDGQSSATGTIDPANFQPGTLTIAVTVTDQNGQTGTLNTDVEIAALPPEITVSGLTAGETLDANRTVTVTGVSQTPITGASYRVDGTELATQDSQPFSFDLDVLALGSGSHIFSVKVSNAGGASAIADVAFVISEGPSLTATALSQPTSVPTEASTVVPTNTPEPTQETALVNTSEPSATVVAASSTPQATATTAATNTPKPSATPRPNLTETAQVEAAIAETATAEVAVNNMLTQQAISAANAQATQNAQQTADAQATKDAQVTEVSPSSTAEEKATAAITPTGASTETTSNTTPEPTFTPIPLTAETQTAATNNNILPIAVICIVGLLILLVVYLFAGRRRTTTPR